MPYLVLLSILPSVFFRVNPWLVFFFPFIDVGMLKDKAVAMGKPHCNRSIQTFFGLRQPREGLLAFLYMLKS